LTGLAGAPKSSALPTVYQVDDDDNDEYRSVEGWIVFAANVHEEAQEDDILDKFGDFGEVK
jgi:hypothetical protein